MNRPVYSPGVRFDFRRALAETGKTVGTAALYPVRRRLSALHPVPWSDGGPVLPRTSAARLLLGQHHGIAPLVH